MAQQEALARAQQKAQAENFDKAAAAGGAASPNKNTAEAAAVPTVDGVTTADAKAQVKLGNAIFEVLASLRNAVLKPSQEDSGVTGLSSSLFDTEQRRILDALRADLEPDPDCTEWVVAKYNAVVSKIATAIDLHDAAVKLEPEENLTTGDYVFSLATAGDSPTPLTFCLLSLLS